MIACISVVLLHQNNIWSYSDSPDWKLKVIIEVICYWAVPVFFMLSGATLIGYEERYSTIFFYKKRGLRTVLPFIFFSLLAYVFSYIPKEGTVPIKDLIIGVFNARFYHLYWFFIPLFWLYLAMPILTYYRKIKEQNKQYAILLLFSLLLVVFMGDLMDIDILYTKNEMAGPVFYVIVGYYMHTHTFNGTVRIAIYSAGILSFILRGILMVLLSTNDGNVNVLLTNYYYPTTIFMAMSVFELFKNMEYSNRIKEVLKLLSSLSLGIYLIHCFVISAENRILTIDIDMFRYILPLAIVTYCVSAVVVWIGKKIPFVKYVLP